MQVAGSHPRLRGIYRGPTCALGDTPRDLDEIPFLTALDIPHVIFGLRTLKIRKTAGSQSRWESRTLLSFSARKKNAHAMQVSENQKAKQYFVLCYVGEL